MTTNKMNLVALIMCALMLAACGVEKADEGKVNIDTTAEVVSMDRKDNTISIDSEEVIGNVVVVEEELESEVDDSASISLEEWGAEYTNNYAANTYYTVPFLAIEYNWDTDEPYDWPEYRIEMIPETDNEFRFAGAKVTELDNGMIELKLKMNFNGYFNRYKPEYGIKAGYLTEFYLPKLVDKYTCAIIPGTNFDNEHDSFEAKFTVTDGENAYDVEYSLSRLDEESYTYFSSARLTESGETVSRGTREEALVATIRYPKNYDGLVVAIEKKPFNPETYNRNQDFEVDLSKINYLYENSEAGEISSPEDYYFVKVEEVVDYWLNYEWPEGIYVNDEW